MMLSLPEGPEIIVAQCMDRLKRLTGHHRANLKESESMAGSLVRALADSMETGHPGKFMDSVDGLRRSGATSKGAASLPGIIAVMEEIAMEWRLDAPETRFLWGLFRDARGRCAANRSKGREAKAPGFAESLRVLKKEIRERRRAEKELRESEHKFRDIAELTPQVIFEQNADGIVTFANKQGLELFGYTEEDLREGRVRGMDLFPADEHDALRENLARTIAGKRERAGYEYTALRKDGSTFPAIIYTTAIFRDAVFSGFRGILVDISELRSADRELRERERRFRDLAESMPQVIFEMDEKGTITFANKQAFTIFGYDEEDLGSVNAFSLFTNDEIPRLRLNLQKIADGGPSTGNEYSAVRKDGSSFPVIIHVARVMKEDRVTGFRGIIVDITERKHGEDKLRASERKFRDIAELTPQVIFEIDTKGSIIFVNKLAYEFFGYKDTDLPAGFNCFDHMLPEDLPRAMENLQKVARGGASIGNEYAAVKKDGTVFPVIIYATRIMDEGRLTGYRGIIIDITERKKAEEELRRTHKELDDRNSFLNALLSAIPTPVFYKDKEGHYLGCNQAFTDQMGFTSDAMKGKTVTDLWSEHADVSRRRDHMVMETGQPQVYERVIRDKNGNRRSAIFTKNVYCYADGSVAGIVCSFMDVTQQKKAQQSLEESEKMYRTFFDSTTDFVFLKDDKLNYILVNKLYLDFFGKGEPEVLGSSDFTLMPIEGAASRHRTDLEALVSDSVVVSREVMGDRVYETLKFPVEIARGKVGVGGFIRDITERTKVEEALKQGEKRLRQIIDLVPHFIFAKDVDGRFILANKAVADTYGTTVEGLIGKGDARFTPTEEQVRHFRSDDMEVIARGTRKHIPEEPITDSQGNVRYIQTVKIPFTFSGTQTPALLGVSVDITERKTAEQALKESEERWQFALEGAGDGLWDWNILTGKVYFSRQWKEMIGFADDEIGDSIDEWRVRLHPDDRDDVYTKLRSHLEGESPVYISQYRFLCKDGTYKWILDRGKIMTWSEDGKPLRIIGTHMDITEHKKTEERLRLDESRTEALLKINQMGNQPLDEITSFTLEESIRLTKSELGYLAFLNDDESVLTMHSWSKKTMEECLIQNRPIIYPLETTGLWGDPVRRRMQLITNDYDEPGLARRGCPEGHVKVKRHLGVPIFDGERIVAVIGVGNKEEEYGETDINQLKLMAQGTVRLLKQKAAQEALSVSESRLRAIIDSAKDAIFIKDTDQRYIVANRAMSELFGAPMEQIIGASDRGLFPGEAAAHIEEVDNRVLQGETIEEEMVRPINNTAYIFHTIKVPLRNERGEITGLCGIARDVTERKHLESQLLQSQKMEAVGTLAGGVAHDFNNLLSAIMGYASLLQMKMEKDNPLYVYASHILTSSEKAATLTQSLLAFSRKQVINLRPVAINDTVEKLHRLLERLIPEDVEFRIRKSPERLIVMADPGQLDQVIMNLITNARDAMPRGGKLTITVERASVGGDFIVTHGYGKAGEYALIAISDTGIGMDQKVIDKIFEPFFTTKGVGRGTGLGLAIVYGIIKQHNGYIDVTSRPGEGSVFCVYLPLVWLEPADEEQTARVAGGTETILVAEDNTDLCELSVKVLEDHGYKVLAARDGAMALETFREHRDDISLVILDVVMPRMNGKEAFDAIRVLDPSVRVIFTSGYTDDIIEEKGVPDEKHDFLGKPITPATLLRKIREVLDRK
ncbi:MAG: PAS domain S-box protein [Syntrophorhabdaceae bacterium]|nr:PAS domain S-box protein [Syntrophorhabdaceae bacterium]